MSKDDGVFPSTKRQRLASDETSPDASSHDSESGSSHDDSEGGSRLRSGSIDSVVPRSLVAEGESESSRNQIRATLFEVSSWYNFIKEDHAADKSYLQFNYKFGAHNLLVTEKKRHSIFFYDNVKETLKSAGCDEELIGKINRHTNHISFPSSSLIDLWSKKSGVFVENSEISQQRESRKKIVVIGLGDIGEAVVNNLVQFHEERRTPCEIVCLNRSEEYAEKRVRDVKKDGSSSFVNVRVHKKASDIDGADLVIMTAGVKAGRTGSGNREDGLMYNLEIIDKYSQMIRGSIKPDGKVIVVTNPVEIVSKLMQEATGLPPKNIIGSGVGLDSIRYSIFLQDKLRESYGCRQSVQATIIGKHDKNGMIFPSANQIMFDGQPLERLVGSSISRNDLDEIMREVEGRVRNEGLAIIDQKSHKGSQNLPADAACKVATELLYGKGHNLLSAAIYVPANNPHVMKGPCYIGMPITISQGNVSVVGSYVEESQNVELKNVSEKLVADRNSINSGADWRSLIPVSMIMNQALDNAEKRNKAIMEFTTLGISSREMLVSSFDKIKEIFDISPADQGSNIVEIKAKPRVSQSHDLSRELLHMFSIALIQIGVAGQLPKQTSSKSTKDPLEDDNSLKLAIDPKFKELFIPSGRKAEAPASQMHVRFAEDSKGASSPQTDLADISTSPDASPRISVAQKLNSSVKGRDGHSNS